MAKTDKKIYEEGNKGFIVFPFDESGAHKSGESVEKIKGLISLEGTVNQTETKTAADDDTAYLVRRSPVTIAGTMIFTGLSEDDYKILYSTIFDSKGAMVYGEGTPKKVGFVFLNTRHEVGDDGVDTPIEQAHIFYSVTFSLPNISTQTISEDDTTIRPFELAFTADPFIYNDTKGDKKSHRVTYARIAATGTTETAYIALTGESPQIYLPTYTAAA